MPVAKQIVIIYAAVKKYLMDIPVEEILHFQDALLELIDTRYPEITGKITETQVIDEETEQKLIAAIQETKKNTWREGMITGVITHGVYEGYKKTKRKYPEHTADYQSHETCFYRKTPESQRAGRTDRSLFSVYVPDGKFHFSTQRQY